jgi:hypothetical protein
MNILQYALLKGGFTPAEVGLPDSVLDALECPDAPERLSIRRRIDGKPLFRVNWGEGTSNTRLSRGTTNGRAKR